MNGDEGNTVADIDSFISQYAHADGFVLCGIQYTMLVVHFIFVFVGPPELFTFFYLVRGRENEF